MSELKTNKVSPATGTALAVGDSGDTITVPSGATLDISASTLTPPATMPASSGVNLTALNATEVTSGTLPIARVADNAVTLAKMAGITRGSIIVGDASGDPSALGVGSNTHILTSDGTDAAWTAPAASGTANQPNFQMRTAGNLAWVNSAYTKIPLATLMWESDSGSCDTTTNYRFTVPAGKGGKYLLSHMMPLPTGGNGYVKILKNGGELNNFWYSWASNFGGIKTFSMTTYAELAAADYLEWWVYSNVNDTVNGDYYITGIRIDT
tara:strand:+ start:129 stop:929 length:801 start_codon:yes stop_codon:yes gene_type:complete